MDSKYRIVLHDELQWLLPTSRLVGGITPDGDSLSLLVEPYTWFDGWISQTDEVLAYVDQIETPVTAELDACPF